MAAAMPTAAVRTPNTSGTLGTGGTFSTQAPPRVGPPSGARQQAAPDRDPSLSRYNHRLFLMPPELSIVVPVLNESPNIKQLYDELTTTLVAGGRSYEIIVIDDGSTDDTFEQLAALQSRDPRLRVIRF